jgi:release factor glutamine methyltransferase
MMSDTQQWTIKRLLDWTTDYFRRGGGETPRLEAEILLAAALDCSRIQLYTRFDEVPVESHLSRFRQTVRRHAAGEPVAYLVGFREFYSLKFEVNSAVLIPRPETEHVVLAALEVAPQFGGSPVTIADIGTGSGCIAITLAKHLPSSRLWATDISPEALAVAQRNAQRHGVTEQIEFRAGDLLTPIPREQLFQVIVSNPPYVGTDEVGTLDPAVEKYEPAVALFAGASGTETTERLIRQAIERLVPGGFLVFETGPIVSDRCAALVRATARFEPPRTIKDLAGLPRVIVAQKLAKA